MKKSALLLIIMILLFSCRRDEMQYAGDLIVYYTEGAEIGLFDISEIQESYPDNEHALLRRTVSQGKAEFKGINPGNYAVSRIPASWNTFKAVQVTVGQTTTLTLD